MIYKTVNTPKPEISMWTARSVCGFSLKIEVECQSQEEAEEAIQAGADIVMLDNFTPEKLKTAASNLKVFVFQLLRRFLISNHTNTLSDAGQVSAHPDRGKRRHHAGQHSGVLPRQRRCDLAGTAISERAARRLQPQDPPQVALLAILLPFLLKSHIY